MKELTKDIINQILNKYKEDKELGLTTESIKRNLSKIINTQSERKAVLGFDIYRYSQYPILEQTLIPYLFKELYNLTILNCLEYEPFLFQTLTKDDFANFFIDAGDGGFQIFNTPLHAVVFSIYFQANIKRFNSGKKISEDLRKILGEITLRYSLTYDKTYYYSKNFYGPSIINNARILTKDKLNRFLLDDNTVKWFTEELNGIENLQVINFEEDFKNLKIFKNYKKNKNIDSPTLLFEPRRAKILAVDLLSIGEIKSKLDTMSIHSLHIQTLMHSNSDNALKKYTVSLGNLNSSGIAE